MPPFEPPSMTRAKDKAWAKVAKADFRDPKVLWTDHWARFNTMSIPIQDEDAFFADAMAAARVAENREHLEQILEQNSRDRRAELADIVSSIAVASISLRTPFSTPASRSAALKAGQTGSLDSFVQLACGVAFPCNEATTKMRKPPVESSGNRGRNSDEARLRNRHLTDQHTCGDAPEAAHVQTSDDTLEKAREGVSDDAYEDTYDDTLHDAYNPTGDPWELENAFPPDLYDVHDDTAGDEHGSEPYDCDPERVAKIIDEKVSEPPSTHADIRGTGRSSARPSQMCSSTPFSSRPKNYQVVQPPSSPVSNNGLSISGMSSMSSEPPSPVTPRTSFGFGEARITKESTTPLHPESPATPELGPASRLHAKSLCKTSHSTTTRKRSLAFDVDGSHGDSNRHRKRRAVG